jgi:hypothetical protein
MRLSWPADTVFTQRVLRVEQPTCDCCQRRLHICDHRFHCIHTFDGPVKIVCKLVHCPNQDCPQRTRTLSPLAETQITLPRWTIGWDVFCWLGHRRFARHWSIPQLCQELRDAHRIPLSEDAIADYLQRYQVMVAARQQAAAVLAAAYADIDSLVLCIDGLQPEKGHETLYVVRELRAKRVWFAEALLSSTTAEVQRLVAHAKQWAAQLGKPVALWMSDKQDAFVQAIAVEFPEVPHRYCQNHFLRDVAKPVLEADSHAKVQMRKKVRGLRTIERAVLAEQRTQAAAAAVAVIPVEAVTASPPDQAVTRPSAPAELAETEVTSALSRAVDAAAAASAAAGSAAPAGVVGTAAAAVPLDTTSQVVLDYCAAVRGILNDDQGGPLHPPGLRMAEALGEVRDSLQRNLEAKKGGARRSTCRS